MGRKSEKKRKKPPVETALDFRARERSAEAKASAEDPGTAAPDGVSGKWE